MTLEELQAIPLQYTFGYTADTRGLRQYVNEEHGIAKQVVTFKLLATGEEFDTIEGLLAAINKEKT